MILIVLIKKLIFNSFDSFTLFLKFKNGIVVVVRLYIVKFFGYFKERKVGGNRRYGLCDQHQRWQHLW